MEGVLCSLQRTSVFLFVSPVYFSPHVQMPSYMTQHLCSTLSLSGNSDLTVLVFQIILNFPWVNSSSLQIKVLLISSFFGQKGKFTVSTCLSSKSQLGIMSSTSGFGVEEKSLMTESINLLGNPTSKYFFLILLFSSSKSDEILSAL